MADSLKLKFFETLTLKVWRGPLRGFGWSPFSRGKILRVLNGSYEPEQSLCFESHISSTSVFFDVGAHVGYYSVIAAKHGAKVVAFEIDPLNLAFLSLHQKTNGLNNLEIVAKGVTEQVGESTLVLGGGSGTGRLGTEGDVVIQATSLDAFCKDKNIWPTHLKIDVEGGELSVLRGMSLVLARKPTIFLSTHGDGIKKQCLTYLEKKYRFEPFDGEVLGDDFLCVPKTVLTNK